ncbi:negative regulator of systemic acquired resistance [Tanacetum coccineum]
MSHAKGASMTTAMYLMARKQKRLVSKPGKRVKSKSYQRSFQRDQANVNVKGSNIKDSSENNRKARKPAALSSAGTEVSYHSLGAPSYQCCSCNATMWYEERNNKGNRNANPTFSLCCQEGKVLLSRFNETPEPLRRLLEYSEPATSRFRDQIIVYNGMFCFTSFGARIDHSINVGRGLYTFHINSQNYHRIGSLLPQEGTQPRYAQLWFFDTQNGLRNRLNAFVDNETRDDIDGTIVGRLIEMLDQNSSIAQAFRMARDWCHSHTSVNVELRLLSERTNSRQYNASTVAEVATLITNDFGDGDPTRDIIVNTKDEDGYHDKIPYHRNTGGRLFQQYLIDAYTAIEEQRLSWTRNNQDTLRVDLYHNVCDAITRGDTNAAGLGKRIVLPHTFTGGPRYMMQNYQDAMDLCRAYGNPDLFITSNPKWPEINEMLAHVTGQRAHDRPEVGTRVFKLKLTELLDDLTKNKIFGESHAVVYVIEFQKRGLPHTHILLWFEDHCKCKTPREIDDIISAELPSAMDDPAGYKAVTDYMLHGPCGKDDRYAPCNVEGNYSKHFPKPIYEETIIDQDGYPIYRRRDDKPVTLRDSKSLPALLEKEGINNITMFTDCFALNDRHPPARAQTYAEIPQYYVCRPLKLWEETWEVLSEDILHLKRKLFKYPELQRTAEQIQNYCLVGIQEVLNRNGRSLAEFQDLPQPNPKLLTNIDNHLIREALEFDMNKSRIEHQQLHSQLRSERKIVLAVASSGIASLLLPARRAAHSRFIIPLELLENSTCGIKQNTHLAKLMKEVKIIIWDEASMMQKYAFEALDKTLRDILGYPTPTNRNTIFGGLTVLLGGDFRQILPVIPKGKRLDIVQACINRSELWKHCKVFTLTRSMWVNEYYANGELDTRKQHFSQWVLAVDDGKLPTKMKDGVDEPTWIQIPKKFLINASDSPIAQIVAETYPNFIKIQKDDAYLKDREILTPRNDDVDAINAYMFDKLEGESITYNSVDEICKASTDTLDQQHLYLIEFLNTLNFPEMPLHALKLKKELPIMLLRNVNPNKGLCDGTRLIIT